MPGGRRISRVMSPPVKHNNNFIFPANATSAQMAATEERLGPVLEMKHIRLPPLRRESNLTFELMIVLHVLLFNALQFLHLYRTVFWLPQSFNSSGVNFYLIDANVVIFVVALLGRRVPYLIIKAVMPTNSVSHWILRVAMTCTTSLWLGLATLRLWNSANLTWLHFIYLFGPFLLYFHVYGLSITHLWEIEEIDNPKCETTYSSVASVSNFQYHHICTNDPNAIREECEMLRKEFNRRLKGVVCHATLIAYYSCFIPWCFVQPFVNYDLWWVAQHLILAWMFIFGLLISRALCPDFSDGLHKAACHLGKWGRLRPNHIPSNQWTGEYLFVPGAIVKHQRELYKAEGLLCVASEPGNSAHIRFQLLFSGSSFSRLLLGFHLSVVLLSLLILIRTSEWYQVISVSSMIITSALTLIRLGRDFLVVWKMYQAEELILTQHSNNQQQN